MTVENTPRAISRWAQLTYASFDLGNGAGGGWQIKETAGNLSNDEVEALRSRIVTSFDPAVPLSAFPSPAELEAMPRRLTYIADGRGRGSYWHSVMAGRDSTGRPGNVFSHVLLDRTIDAAEPAIRPIELWRSPDLMCPFGPEQVAGSGLSNTGQPVFGAGLSRETVLEFLFDPGRWRIGLLSVLLDAASAALRGGPRIVLVADSAESAALWIGAVASLASPSTARSLSFSVYERAGALATVFERGVHLACVPRSDVPDLSPDAGYAILDEREMPDLGEADGQPHETQAGSLIVATVWSELAQSVLVNAATAAVALAELDDISARVGDTGREPAWPLAMAVVRLSELFGDLQDEAAAVVKMHSPDALRHDQQLLSLATSIMGRDNGGGAVEAWDDLQRLDVSPSIRDTLINVYIARALDDPEWVARTGPIPLPPDYRPELATPELRASARQAVFGIRTKVLADPRHDSLCGALRFLDFLCRGGLVDLWDADDDVLAEATTQILECVVGSVIDEDAAAAAMVAAVGQLSPPRLCQSILAAVESTARFHTSAAGHRIPPPFCDWLLWAAAPAELERFFRTATETSQIPELLGEIALWQCVSGQGPSEGARPIAAMALMADGPARPHNRLWDAVFSPASVWSPGELLAVERRCPGHLPGHTFVPALVLEPRSGTLDQLVDLIEKERGEGEGPEVDFARLRLESRGGWTTRYAEQLPGVADWIIETVQAALEAVYPGSLPPEVTDAVVVAAVLVAGHQPGGYAWPSLVRDLVAGYEPKPDAGAVRVLQDCADLGLLGGQLLQRLAEVALENAPGYPDPPSAPRHPLSGVTWDTASGPVPLLEVPLRRVLATCPASTSAALSEALTGRLWPKSSESMSDRRAEKAYDDRDRFLRSWWKSLVEPTASPRPTFLGALRPGTRKDR